MNRNGWRILAAAFTATLAGLVLAGVPAERVGVCSWSFQKPLREVAAEMDRMGIRGIHLALGPFIAADGRHGAAESVETFAFVKEKIRSGAWKLMSTMIGFPQEDYSTLETIRRTGGIVPDACWEANRRLLSRAAELSQELGSRYLSLHAGFLDESDPKAYAKYVERVSWMRDECRKHGVELILESGQETAEDLAKFMAAVPGVGINFDPANMILYGKGDPVRAVDRLGTWIRQVHVKDANVTQVPGTWGTETPWGDGQVGGNRFLQALDAIGYRGNFVIEREGGTSRVRDIALAVTRLTAAGPNPVPDELEEDGEFDRWFVGVNGTLFLPQGGSKMRRLGGASLRVGYYVSEFWAIEGEAAWLENVAGLSADALWHWWGYERFDPFFTFGAKGWIGRAGQVGPKVGIGAFYHLTDAWSLRGDADATLGLDTACEVDYSLSVGVQRSF